MDKIVWTVAGPHASVASQIFLDSVGAAIRNLVPSTTEAHVTLQQSGAFGQAIIDSAGSTSVEAVLEVVVAQQCPPLDAMNDHLRGLFGNVQGWRAKSTVIFDTTELAPIGRPFESPSVFVFIERLDGTTPEHFNRNWYVHAGHLDGEEAESEETRVERRKEEAAGSQRLYRQNRFVEPVTPTTWVVHGCAELQLGGFVPSIGGQPYPRVRGEAPFDRWPPRVVQGYKYKVV